MSTKWLLSAIGVAVAIASLGLKVVADGQMVFGWTLVGVSLFLLAGILAVRWLTMRVVKWLGTCADYGTTSIQNVMIATIDEVESLRQKHDGWVEIIREGADKYLLDADARRLKKLDYMETQRKLPGVNSTHSHLRQMAAERVSRLRDMAARLQRGDTHLRRYWP